LQRRQQLSAIGVRVRSHAAVTGWSEHGKFVAELAVFIEQFARPIALHPIFELLQVLWILEICDRNLMRAPRALDWLAVHEFRSGPAFRRAENKHGPARALQTLIVGRGARRVLDRSNL